jgi:type VI protein secretion system component VasF
MLGYGTSVPSDDILGEVDDVYEARKPSMRVKRDIAKMVPIAVLIMGACAAAAIAYIMFFN